MAAKRNSRSWGIPWLGLPLSGVLALAGAANSVWLSDARTPALRVVVPGAVAARGDSGGPDEEPDLARRRPDRSARLGPGETLGILLNRLGVDLESAHAAAQVATPYVDLRQLRAGTIWNAYFDSGHELERLELVLAGRGLLGLSRRELTWQPDWTEFRRETRLRAVAGRLDGSLEASMARAGAPPELAYSIADVLQWDLDFSRDLRHDDEFRVLYEEVAIEGYEPKPERVLAVSYGRQGGRRIEAYSFGEGARAGYYDAEGRPLQKMFLRSPLPYSRVTSGFSNRRFHPILGVFRPHHGVDYGAPVGTPVRVTASGTVVSAGWDGGGGRTVKVRHPNGYLTGYLHLSGFAKGIRAGEHVSQGQVIGFVGDTGLATAPHLDYRVQANGRWIDPLSIKSVPAQPISTLEMARFSALRDALRQSLATGEPPELDGVRLAASTSTSKPATPRRASTAGRKR